MADEFFVLDGLVHALNSTEGNVADPVPARASMEGIFRVAGSDPSGYAFTRNQILHDWTIEEVADLLFRESETAVGVFNPQPLFVFKDGMTSVEKAAEAIEKFPTRFVGTYAAIDPLRKGWERELERQVDELRPLGLKLYPASWQEGTVIPYDMSDPSIAFPVYEKAGELGIDRIAIHKALPVGPMEYRGSFNPKDIEGAAVHFPDVDFEIVHGGMAFVEETAWLVGRFPNIFVNLENLNIVLARRPRVFAKALLGLAKVAGNEIYNRLQYGTGAPQYHPQPGIDAFKAFQFPEDLLEEAGMYLSIDQITDEDKRKILGQNFADRHGLDIDALRAGIQGDGFRALGEPVAPPLSTLRVGADLPATAAGSGM